MIPIHCLVGFTLPYCVVGEIIRVSIKHTVFKSFPGPIPTGLVTPILITFRVSRHPDLGPDPVNL